MGVSTDFSASLLLSSLPTVVVRISDIINTHPPLTVCSFFHLFVYHLLEKKEKKKEKT